MGILWTVWPLDDQMRDWLDELDVSYPDAESRFPTGSEIKGAVAALSNEYNIVYTDNGVGGPWQAAFSSMDDPERGPWALLNVQEYKGDGEINRFGFEKGWESLNIEIVRAIAQSCGPLVLIDDAGHEPTVVAA